MKYQAYKEYKDSGVEWLGKVPKFWKTSCLRWYINIASGEGLSNADFDKTHDEVNRFRVIGGNGTLGYSAYFNTSSKAFAIGRVGALCGNVHFINEVCWITDNALKLTTWVELQDHYFLFLLKAAKLNEYASTTAQPLITGEQVKALRVVIPPIDEQQIIANFLDHETAKIDTLIEKQQQLIKLLKEKRQAVISHAVTKGLNPNAPMCDSGVEWLGDVPEHWEVKKISYVINAIGDVDHYMPQSIEKGIPYVMTGDLKGLASSINFEDCKQVSHKDYLKLSSKIKSSKGDVIMARYATIGTASYIDIDADFLVSYSCVTIKPNLSKAFGLYLFYYFKSAAFLQGIKNQINTNTQENVGVNDLKKVKVALPTLDEQSRIIEYLQSKISKINSISDRSQTAINLMQERRTALISAAVTGKIDLRNWQSPNKEKREASV